MVLARITRTIPLSRSILASPFLSTLHFQPIPNLKPLVCSYSISFPQTNHLSQRTMSTTTNTPTPPRPTRSLSGKVAIVTGAGAAGQGIGNGRAASILLAEAGCSVVCVDLQLPLAQTTAEMITSEGDGKALALAADVTSDSECKDIVSKTMQEFGRIDILVNNVGIMGSKGTAVDVDLEGWDKGMTANVKSMMLMSRHCIPQMLKNPHNGFYRGSIVNLGSVAGLRGGTPTLLYPTTKGAVVNMTRAMAYQHAADGIRVNCVCPGMLYTPMMYEGQGGRMSEEMRTARRERSLLKTEGNGWDAGAAVRFLAGEESR